MCLVYNITLEEYLPSYVYIMLQPIMTYSSLCTRIWLCMYARVLKCVDICRSYFHNAMCIVTFIEYSSIWWKTPNHLYRRIACRRIKQLGNQIDSWIDCLQRITCNCQGITGWSRQYLMFACKSKFAIFLIKLLWNYLSIISIYCSQTKYQTDPIFFLFDVRQLREHTKSQSTYW